jgi:hypothetical protein
MVISYLAHLPAHETFQLVHGNTVRRIDPDGQLQPGGQTGQFLLGRFSDRSKDVTVEYYRRRGRRPPYLVFAENSTDTDAILDFTAQWGVLTMRHSLPAGWQAVRREPWCPWRGDQKDFLMDLSGWQSLHQRFQKMLKVAAEPDYKAHRELCHLLTRESNLDFDAGNVHLGLEWEQAAYQPRIVAGSLYMAFVAMLWLDVAARGRKLLRCADPGCSKYFSTERPDKIYCDRICALRTSRRNWWRRHGQAWRNDRLP